MGIALAGVIFTGCKKTSTEADTDSTAAQDDANASFVLNDSKTIADGAAKGQANERLMGTCAVLRKVVDTSITIGSVTYTTDTLWDVAFSGTCVSPDGRTRKGHILICWTGKGYFDSGAVVSETFKNYSVYCPNSGLTIGVTGYRQLTNIGKDSLGEHSWSFNAALSLAYSSGGTATWNSSRKNILTYNAAANDWFYVITGSASGTSKSGVAYNLTITSPLYWTAYWINILTGRQYCDCIESGQVELTRTGKKYPLYLTFTSGIGKCGHTATATINGNNYNITLP